MKELSEEEVNQIEEAALKNLANFGLPKDIFHPEYGWVMLDGKITESGKLFFGEYD